MSVAVRNYEIDWQGVVHNAHYLHYFEIGRIEYLNAIGARLDINTVNNGQKVVLVRNEINYRLPAHLGDTLTVRSRISRIGRTSFVFEGMLERQGDGAFMADNVAVHVWLDPQTGKPTVVPAFFRDLVKRFEGEHCDISGEP